MNITKHNVFRTALLGSAAAISLAVPGIAFAQASGDVEVDEIQVTGSRIPRVEYQGNIPGVAVESEQIERRAFTNALDVLNDVPLVGTGTAINTNGGQPSSLGVAFVDLLDLGTARTLTLVNGRRFVSGNAATLFVAGNETGSQVDVNSIPVSLIDRVDVLTVGGAAAYGSDAIAGVVNYILKDRYEGAEISAQAGITARGDAGTVSLRGLVGQNFLEDRANIAVSFEYNHIDSLTADERPFRANNPQALTNYANGSLRNPNFNPFALATGANTPFLPATSDLIPGTTYLTGIRSTQVSHGGVIFQPLTAAFSSPTAPAVNQIGPAAAGFFAGNTQLVSGTPVACVPDPVNICRFAPSSIAAADVARVFTRYGVTPPAGSTAAQQQALATAILQANRPTPREYLAANPNTNINDFLGTFITAFPDVANTGANAAFLPRTAVPLRFNAQGNVETFVAASFNDPTTPGTVGGAPGSEGYNAIPYTVTRAKQDRYIGNLFGNIAITDNITFFNETLVARVETVAPRDSGGLASSAASGTIENAALVMNVNNPFLDAADRAALAAVGITNNFVLSRTNQDIFGDNPATGEQDTFRTVNGLRGAFNLLDRNFSWEASATYGKVTQDVKQGRLRDLEYALALDVARDASGNIVCRAKLQPSAFLGLTPPGVTGNIVRTPGPDGIPTERILTPVVTQDLIDSCVPLNPFGENQMSEAAKAYVRGDTVYHNEAEQLFLQAFLSGEIIDLPAGPLEFSIGGEYRKDELAFTTNEVNRLGRTRSAPSAQTFGETTTYEYGGELRIPIFGGDFTFPLMHSLEFAPAVRYSKQEGSAPAFRNLAGNIVEQESEGEFERIYSLALTYQPIRDITLRGNVTESLRNPSVVELFLGGQPAFTTPVDPCSNNRITAGSNPTLRRANCEAAVIAAGLASNQAQAAAFLNTYVSTERSVQGGFSGSPSLAPERAKSKTYGIVLEPRFIPNFRLSVDYIELELEDQIIPTTLAQATQFCYDSATFPDTTAQLGANTCNFFTRDNTFNVTDGFGSGFLNLSATRIRAYNSSLEYRNDVSALLGRDEDWGSLRVRANLYRLDEYASSPSGSYTDTSNSAGDIVFDRPEWRGSLNLLWERGPLDVSWNVSYESQTQIYTNGTPNTIEQTPILSIEEFALHSATVGYELNERVRLQFTVDNIFGYDTYGYEGFLSGFNSAGYPDGALGRRFIAQVRAKF